ncbi:MAG: hypothetical protein Q4F96_04560, partial [Bacillota bacterium]|nr:hypothetical protein [Bacillota bacterium]
LPAGRWLRCDSGGSPSLHGWTGKNREIMVKKHRKKEPVFSGNGLVYNIPAGKIRKKYRNSVNI